MAYIIKGGKGTGATLINPEISLSGLEVYIDPLSVKSYTGNNNPFFSLTNNSTFTTLTTSVSVERNNKFKYIHFNSQRNMTGTYLADLSSCAIQLWVRRNQKYNNTLNTSPVYNYISFAAGTGGYNSEHWLHDVTFTTSLTTINFNNFKDNMLIAATSPKQAEIIGNSIRLTTAENGQHGHVYLNTPVRLKDSRENNIDWQLYYEISFGKPVGSIADGMCVIFNSELGRLGLAAFGLGYETIPNSLAVCYDNWENVGQDHPNSNHVQVNYQGSVLNTLGVATPYFNMRGTSGTNKRIYNWLNYNSSSQQLSVFISETTTKPLTSLIVVDNFDIFSYLPPPYPPFIRDIITTRVTSVSTYGIYVNNLNKLGFSVGDVNINTNIDSVSGEWSLITLNFEPSSVKIYNNLTYYETEKPKNIFKTDIVNIGNTNDFDIGQILIYNRHLTDREIFNNYKNFLCRYDNDIEKQQITLIRTPLDPDTLEYVNRADIKDYRVINKIDTFIIGLKQLDLYDYVNCWPLIQEQNTKSGNILKSFGNAYENVDAEIIGTYSRTNSGIGLGTSSYINTHSPGITGNDDRTIMMVTNNNPFPGFYGGWGIGQQSWPPPGATFDPDTINFLNRVGTIVDDNEKIALDKFVKGIKRMGIWNNMVCWPMINSQNANGTNTVFSLGGGGIFNGTLLNSPTWTNQGLSNSSGTNGKVITSKKNINYNRRSFYAVGRTNVGNFINRGRYMHTGFGEPGFMEFDLKCAGMTMNDTVPGLNQCGVGVGFATTTLNARTSSMEVCASTPNTLGTWRSHAAVFGNRTLRNYRDAILVGQISTTGTWADSITDGTILALMDCHDPDRPTSGSCLLGVMAFGADFDIELSQSQLNSLDILYKSTLGRNLPMTIPQDENLLLFPGNSWSIKKPNTGNIFQEFYFYNLNPIVANRGVGVSYGSGQGITWSNSDVSIESVNGGSVNTSSGDFYINRGYEYEGEKNNEIYSIVIKSKRKFTENDFFNVYNLYKNSLGRDIGLPLSNEPINYDIDTIRYLDRVDEQKPYFYRKALNDFIVYLKENNIWDNVVCFPLGFNVNKLNGNFQSFGNYTPNYNYEAVIVGSSSTRQEHGLLLNSTSYLSSNVPSVEGSQDRYLMLITNGSNTPGFILGEGINTNNRSFNLKRTGGNAIIDCWFNSSNQFPNTKCLVVDLSSSKYQVTMLPDIKTYYGNIQNLDVAEGNVVLNAGNVGYMSERSNDAYYFLLKAKNSFNFDINKTISLYNKYATTIGLFNNQISPPNGTAIEQSAVKEFVFLSGNYVDYSNYVRFTNFVNQLQIANNDINSPLYNLNLYDNMVCWPLRRGQTAGGNFTSRATSDIIYSFGGLPQASAYRVGTMTEDNNGVTVTSSTNAASARIITSTRKLTGYNQRTFYTAANITSYSFNRRARMMYTTFAEPTFIEFSGPTINGMILEGRGFGSQIANTTSNTLSGNFAAAAPVTIPVFNTFNTFGSIYSNSSISHIRNNTVISVADESQNSSRPYTPGWSSALTDRHELTLLNSETEPLPFGGSIIGTLAFAADFNIGLTQPQLSTFDVIYKSTLGEGITFQ